MNGLIGKKIGMTSIFDSNGKNIACTVIEAQPNIVTQVKTNETDGYDALQLGYGEAKAKNTSSAMIGHFKCANTTPKRKVAEFRNATLDKKLGDEIVLTDIFSEGDKVSAIGTSKGKGYQGVVKRHNFSGVGQATLGQHNRLRAPGSIGASATPSRVVKGMRMSGRMGNERVKTKNLKIVKLLPEKNLILIQGSVPGHKGSFVIIEK
ncbi:MAG TPA: 50S ribosomal protein L3 [Saprospiraceae bacterium]|jgi:large subunit ribosomal protein L3|nr:50S ribosomal protein L3 [Saprospiraceae bacterium]HRO08321.1 50S ribosomal protein L3 [Saprospiraceae bacterium]HRP41730.1 50S ribosomal protein L3 [Saprospiraceae bacterium]